MSVNRVQAWMGSDDELSAVATAADPGPFSAAPISMNWLVWQCQMYQWAYEQALSQLAPTRYELAQRPSLN